MNFKEKASLMILGFLKSNSDQSFTVKEIGLRCFSENIHYFHNVSEFLESLNDQGLITFTDSMGNEVKRSKIKNKVMNGKYQYKAGEGIYSEEKILDLWKQETIKFIKKIGVRGYTITQIAREICGDTLRFMNTQSIVMKELESEQVVYFNNQGVKTFKGDNNINGTWSNAKAVQAWR